MTTSTTNGQSSGRMLKRMSVNLSVTLILEDRKIRCNLHNISAGGACLAVPLSEMPVSDLKEQTLSFELGTDKPIVYKGKILRHSKTQTHHILGVMFK